MTAALTALDAQIRQAVLADSFTEVPPLIDRYAAELERYLREQPLSQNELTDLMRSAHGLFEWAGIMVRVARNEMAAGLANSQRLGGYRAPIPEAQRLQARA